MRRGALVLLMLLAWGAPGCHRKAAPRAPAVRLPASAPTPPARVLILREAGDDLAGSARELAMLMAHFDERCSIVLASQYEKDSLGRYAAVFYLAGGSGAQATAGLTADLAGYGGTVVWVGAGLEALGEARLRDLHMQTSRAPAGAADWALSYRNQVHGERLAVPAAQAGPGVRVWAEARRGDERRPYLVGAGKLWYAAAGPQRGPDHFWSRCIWGDALHELLGSPHQRQRQMLAVLQGVPVWANEQQVPNAIRPLLAAGIPIGVLAAASAGEVLLSDRPAAVRGLRQAESLGAVLALAGPPRAGSMEARDHLHMAWEVGLHPLAWVGAAGQGNPFRLRVADREDSPPFSAGGLLPSPISISDGGQISAQDRDRLHMLSAVRDGVALISFGLWAPAGPLLRFLRVQQRDGWQAGDLRDLDALVTDPRRTLVSGRAKLPLPTGARLRKTVLGRDWQPRGQETVTFSGPPSAERSVAAPPRSVVVLEPVRPAATRPMLTGVTLDPWAYTALGVSAETLAEALAERYSRNGVNTVFFYAYNVSEGAAYRTRYPGASLSAWGRQDLLGHLLQACRAHGIKVVAWLYSGRDRGAWLRHPEWRERTAGGKEYNPLRLHATYFLCPRNPEVRGWYAGLVRDLAHHYPTLAGIELCEPLVNWWGDQACYCQVCRRAFAAASPGQKPGGPAWRRLRAEGLTGFLSQCLEAISEEGVETYVMTISDAWSNGAILSARRQAEESGFDLDGLLDGPHPPDWVNFELIWQQWAAIYGTAIFNPGWAAEVAQQLVRRTHGRARVILHVELTDFGPQLMTPARIADTISRVSVAKPDGVECYHSAAIDSKMAWTVLRRSFEALR